MTFSPKLMPAVMRDFPVNLYLGGPGIEQIIFGVFQEQAAGPTTAVGAGGGERQAQALIAMPC